jgi:hypothetical protein
VGVVRRLLVAMWCVLAWLAVATPASAAPTTTTPASQQAATSGSSSDFRYSEILLLPLAVLAGIAYVARALTADATPSRMPRKMTHER